MEILCKWNGNFLSNRLERKKWSTSEGCRVFFFRKIFILSTRFFFFAFQPVELEILINGKRPMLKVGIQDATLHAKGN